MGVAQSVTLSWPSVLVRLAMVSFLPIALDPITAMQNWAEKGYDCQLHVCRLDVEYKCVVAPQVFLALVQVDLIDTY